MLERSKVQTVLALALAFELGRIMSFHRDEMRHSHIQIQIQIQINQRVMGAKPACSTEFLESEISPPRHQL